MRTSTRYDVRVDAVLDGHGRTGDFTPAEWLRLARAALDQAGKAYVSLAHEVQECVEELEADRCESCDELAPCGRSSCGERAIASLRADHAIESAMEGS